MITVRVHIEAGHYVSSQDIRNLLETAQNATDRALNTAPRLLNGDRLLIDIVSTTDPSTAHLRVTANQAPGDRNNWSVHARPETLINNIRQQLGLFPHEHGTNPSLTLTELRQLSNDIAAANTPARFTGLPDTRIVDHHRLRDLEDDAYQAMVEDSLRQGDRFTIGADPRFHPYGRLVNDGGPGFDGRGNNCLDCSLAALSSFFGSPQVSLPRWLDRRPDGTIDLISGENDGPQRAADWLGGTWQSHQPLPLPDQFAALHRQITSLGPGSAALVVNYWHARDPRTGALLYNQDGTPEADGSHATVIVYPPGASGPVWWDPQSGIASDRPSVQMVHNSFALWAIPISSIQGAHSAGPVPNQGTSGAVPGTNLQSEPDLSDLSVRTRLGMPADSDTRADREWSGTRVGELRGERPDGSSDRPREPRADDDRGDVRRSDPDRTTSSGSPGVPTSMGSDHRSDTGRPDRSGVPGPRVLPDGTTRPTPIDHQQTNTPVADRDTGDPSRVRASDGMGTREPEPGRDVASPRRVQLLTTTPGRIPSSVTHSSRDYVARSQDDASQEPVHSGSEIHQPGQEYPDRIDQPPHAGDEPNLRAPGSSVRDLRHSSDSATDAYNAIRNADDIDSIVEQLENARRPDGSRYTQSDIEAVKNHLFYDQHLLTAIDGGLVNAHFEANLDIADAWVRLRSGDHTDSDLLLLEHELAEHDHLARHPGASYADAHRAANEIADWEHNRQLSPRRDTVWEGPIHQEDRSLSVTQHYPGGRTPELGQSGAEIRPPSDATGPNGERIWDIPEGSTFGEGAGKEIPPSLLRAYNVGVQADPNLPATLCSYCRFNIATSIDHVEPQSRGGDLTAENTCPGCGHCNDSKWKRLSPQTPPSGFEGIYPPPHWPERMRLEIEPYSHYPRIQDRAWLELQRARENLLGQVEQKAIDYAARNGIVGDGRIKKIAREYSREIDREIDDLQREVHALIRHVDFNPIVYDAWIAATEEIPLEVRAVGQKFEQATFIRYPDSEDGIAVRTRSSEHFVALIVQNARNASDVAYIARDAFRELEPIVRPRIQVENYDEATRFGRGEDVIGWEPDRGNALAERQRQRELAESAQALSDPDPQSTARSTPSRDGAGMRPPAMWDPSEREAMTLAERETARNEAARDREQRKMDLSDRERARNQRAPLERDAFDRELDNRQRARDELAQTLDAREHKRDQRARDPRAPEEIAKDDLERERDERARANIDRGWMRDERERERYERAIDGRPLPELVRELDARGERLDVRERILDERELASIEREREGLNPTSEQQRQIELDARERIIIERERNQLLRELEQVREREGREPPTRTLELDKRVRVLDARERELNGRELASIEREREGLNPTSEQQRQIELDARERIIIERERNQLLRELELVREGREVPERVRELDARERILDGRELASIERQREGLDLTPEQQRQIELDARERIIIERERNQLLRELEQVREREGRQPPTRTLELDERVRELDVRERELDGRELASIEREREGRTSTSEQQRELELDARERVVIERERNQVLREVEQVREREGRQPHTRTLELGDRVRELDARERELDGRELASIEREREGRNLTPEQQRELELDTRERVVIERERNQVLRELELTREGREAPERVRELDARERQLNGYERNRVELEREYIRLGHQFSPFQREGLDWDRMQSERELAQIARDRELELGGRDPITRLLRERGLDELARAREDRVREARERVERERSIAPERERDHGRERW